MKPTRRQQIIIDELRLHGPQSTRSLLGKLAQADQAVSEDSVARDLARLKIMDFLQSSGQGPARRHQLSASGWLLSPIDMAAFEVYLAAPRPRVGYDRTVVSRLFTVEFFDKAESRQLAQAQKTFAEFMDSIDSKSRERWNQKWLIEFAWKSSVIEGNTYSVLETETLLIDRLEATGKSHAEAQMILNHQTALRFAKDNSESFRCLDLGAVMHIHELVVEGLGISTGLRKHVVGISGSVYAPISIPSRIKEELQWLVDQQKHLKDPWTKALAVLMGLSYLQPFADGNKRTARIVANGILQAHDAPPLIFASTDPTGYRRACLAFYELGSLQPIKQIVTASWQQTLDQLQAS